jgi:hypothetical protein
MTMRNQLVAFSGALALSFLGCTSRVPPEGHASQKGLQPNALPWNASKGEVFRWVDQVGTEIEVRILEWDCDGKVTVSRLYGGMNGDDRQIVTVPLSYLPILAIPIEINASNVEDVQWRQISGTDDQFECSKRDDSGIRLVACVTDGRLGDVRVCVEEHYADLPRHTMGPPPKDRVMQRRR